MELYANAVYQIVPSEDGLVQDYDKKYDEIIDSHIKTGKSNDSVIKSISKKTSYAEVRSFNKEDETADIKIIHGTNKGKTRVIDVSKLKEPDIYPRFMYSPKVWCEKVNAGKAIVEEEINAKIEEALKSEEIQNELIGFSFFEQKQPTIDRTLRTVKMLLQPYFGGFLLALLIGYIKKKIDTYLNKKQKVQRDPKLQKIAGPQKSLKGF